MMKWFSDAQDTIEEAQMLHQPGVLSFDPAAVFQTQEGLFVMGLLQVRNWSMDLLRETDQMTQELTGNKMVSYCEPVFGIWKRYEH